MRLDRVQTILNALRHANIDLVTGFNTLCELDSQGVNSGIEKLAFTSFSQSCWGDSLGNHISGAGCELLDLQLFVRVLFAQGLDGSATLVEDCLGLQKNVVLESGRIGGN